MTGFEVRFLIVAGLLHGVGLPVAAAIAPAPAGGAMLVARPRPSELSIDVSASEFRTSAVIPRPGEMRPGPGAQSDSRDRYDATRPYNPGRVLTAEEDAEQPPDEENTFPSAEGDPDDPFNRPPSRTEVDGSLVPGLGDHTAYLPDDSPGRSTPAPTEAPKRKFDPDQGTKAVQNEMRKDDAKKGLDFPGRGPIRAAFVGAVYSSGAPDVCDAVFSVSVSPSGKVTDVSLGAFNGGDSAVWAAVRKIVKAELSGVTLVMRSAYAKGAIVSVMVRSSRQSPSGAGSGWDGGTGAKFDITDIGTKDIRKVSAIINPQPVE